MNPYQRIVRNGRVLQNGHIDTQREFADLTAGIDLADKTVLDVGCNLGEMCRMAKDRGARFVCGIDKERDYIRDARRLNPDIEFHVKPAAKASGNYDLTIASAMFHYVADQDGFFAHMARVSQLLAMSVWLIDDSDTRALMTLSERGLWVPNRSGFQAMAANHWERVECRGLTVSPDASSRYLYRLSRPRPKSARAVLLYGPGQSGKTTAAREMLGYEHLQLDVIFLEWRMLQEKSASLSVMDFVDALWVQGDRERIGKYLAFHERYLRRWLPSRVNLEIVIEGYDMLYPEYRSMVDGVVRENWSDIVQLDTRRDA